MIPKPFPKAGTGDVQIFDKPNTVTSLQWYTWEKPPGCSMVYILCIGGGSGGGGGFSAAANNTRGGGGGGAASPQTRVMVQASLIPDILYVQVGAGGQGVATGNAGDGVRSYVAVSAAATIVASNVLAVSASNVPSGAGTGTSGAVGSNGGAGTVATAAVMNLAGLGHWDVIVGPGGQNGGSQAGGASVATTIPVTGSLCMGAPGGSGCNNADMANNGITAIANSYLSQCASQPPAAGSFDGSGGFAIFNPFFSFCGLGGSSSNTGNGGAGGNGGPGSGGGGGGAGVTGGRGGNGGDGIVIIIAI